MPSGEAFVTVSRDKNMKIWEQQGGEWECKTTMKFALPITAVDILGKAVDDRYWIMLGLEDGGLELLLVEDGKWESVEKVEAFDTRFVLLTATNNWRVTENDAGLLPIRQSKRLLGDRERMAVRIRRLLSQVKMVASGFIRFHWVCHPSRNGG
jgi:hypothetical protein